jgi:hypothetical protein
LITDDHLNVIMNDGKPNPDVWAIGDAAKIEDAPLPATSQGQLLLIIHDDRVDQRPWLKHYAHYHYQLQTNKRIILSRN